MDSGFRQNERINEIAASPVSASPAQAGVQGVPLNPSVKQVRDDRPVDPRLRGEGG
jgi:hypothetical protein